MKNYLIIISAAEFSDKEDQESVFTSFVEWYEDTSGVIKILATDFFYIGLLKEMPEELELESSIHTINY